MTKAPKNDPCATSPSIKMAAMASFLDRILTPAEPFALPGISPESLANMAVAIAPGAEQRARDSSNPCRYRKNNVAVSASGDHPDAALHGVATTELRKFADPGSFSAILLDQEISGQTSPQILPRFPTDVAAFSPRLVHVLAGTDDMALDNFRAMPDLAEVNGIKVVLAGIVPVAAGNNELPVARGATEHPAAHARSPSRPDPSEICAEAQPRGGSS